MSGLVRSLLLVLSLGAACHSRGGLDDPPGATTGISAAARHAGATPPKNKPGGPKPA